MWEGGHHPRAHASHTLVAHPHLGITPTPTHVLQAAAALGRALGSAAYSADVWLEERGVLGEVRPAAPKRVRAGGLTLEEVEVGRLLTACVVVWVGEWVGGRVST